MSNKKIKYLRDDLYQNVENKKDKEISINGLWSLYHKYEDYKNSTILHNTNNDDTDDNDLKVLYFILEKLYIAKHTDTDLISAVIINIHADGIGFKGIISDIFNESNNFITDEKIQLLEYCLKYAYMKKMVFHGSRVATLNNFFTSLLTETYFTPHLPKVILILLQYGMLMDPITGRVPSIQRFSEYPNDLPLPTAKCNSEASTLWFSIIERGIIKQNPRFLPVNELPKKQRQILNISTEVANLFMRDSMQFKLTEFRYSSTKQQYFMKHPINADYSDMALMVSRSHLEFNEIKAIEFIQKLGHFLPELPHRCLEPMSLKHNCKRIIRQVLYLNWQLPSGIFNLNIPKELTKYLNLQID